MSIYASTFDIGDEHKPRCARLKRIGKGMYEQNDSQPCTCGSAPIRYQGSHIVPSDKDPRDGCLMLAAIPGHIDSPKLKAISDDMQPYHPWLRLSLFADSDSILLTRKQVEGLRDNLTRWLELAEQPRK